MRPIWLCLFSSLLLTACSRGTEPALHPNFIFLLVDDWGWRDGSSLGSDFYRTPNIDGFIEESMQFETGYSACTVCSPSRAAILTGLYPARLHLTDWIPGEKRPHAKLKVPHWTKRLEHRYVSLAEALKERGYRTAHVGKWHLMPTGEEDRDDYRPERHGFEINIGGNEWGMPGTYFHPYERAKYKVSPLPSGGHEGDYLTDRLTDEALKIIETWAEEPFFLYFAYYTVHMPLEAKREIVAKYREAVDLEARHTNFVYAAMLESLDQSVGRILQKLEELGIDDRTVIFLTGDNGGLDLPGGRGPTDNAPLREGKGSAYEGGVRVPAIVRWPGVTRGGAVSKEPVMHIDYYPTILEIVGKSKDPSNDPEVDGVSLVPLLRNPSARLDPRELYWHYPHYHGGGATPYGAIRSGNWRLVEFYEDNRVELYNLADDAGELHDLAADDPGTALALKKKLEDWRETVQAQMPTPNPEAAP